MISGVAITFGILVFLLAAIAGGFLILVAAHLFLRKYHELQDYLLDRRNGKKDDDN